MSSGTFGSAFVANNGFNVNNGGWTSFDRFPRQVADVNGDGLADIIGFGQNAVFVSLGQSNGTFGSAFIANNSFNVTGGGWTSFDRFPRQVADVNGDGLADIIGFGQNSVFVSLGQSNGTFGSAFIANNSFNVTGGGWTSFDRFPRQVADVNGDGLADIIGFGQNSVFVSLGQSNGTFGSAFIANNSFNVTGGGWTSFDRFPRQVADVNGDGRADIIGFGQNAVFVSLGQSNGTFGSAFVASNAFNVNNGGWTSFNRFPRQVADVNGDGFADIIGFGENAVFVSLGQSNGTFAPEVVANNSFNVNGGGWTSFDRFPRQVADVNGDGRADIIGFGQNAVFVSLGQSNNTINGGSGNDILNGGSGNDTINGGAGNDTINGASGNDILNGEVGNDTFKGSQGNDSINGGDGIDIADYSQLGQSITLSGVGTIQKAGGLGQDTLFKVERVIANSSVANNTIDASQSLPGVSITVNLQTQSLAANNVPGLGTLSFTAVNFDNVIGTNANDSIIGDNQNNQLSGGGGNDTINGGGGNDTLKGGAGSDTFKGSQGNDNIDGGDGIDIADYSQLGQSITLSGVGTIQKAGGLGQDTLFKVERVIANASVANNTIDASQSLPGVSITVNLQTQSLAANNVPGLGTLSFTAVNFDNVIGTNANDSIFGDNQNNELSGNNGNDTINGGGGNDRLIGGNGTDLLTGGSGNDIFEFNSVSESQPGLLRDVINDFVGNGNLVGDQIDLFSIDANSATLLVNDAFTFIGTNSFTAAAQVRYVGGILQGNINANLTADFEIRLAGAPGLVASDIIL